MQTTSSRPFQDPISDRLGYVLRRASSVMMADLGGALAVTGLRPVEATILILVEANPRCTQSDIGRMLGIKRANMVPLIAGLSAKGLIDKSPVDGRSQSLTLTAAGRDRRDQADALMRDHEARFEAMLSSGEVDALRTALGRLMLNDASEADQAA